MANISSSLENLATQIHNCTSCNLCTSKTYSVPGEGNSDARILFIGEGPGQTEDLKGRPFIGRSGELLDKALVAADLSRTDVFITNIVKCRPPGNRNPTQEEMDACYPFLMNQIRYIRPNVIVVLGKVAAEYILERPVKITKEQGKIDFLPDFWRGVVGGIAIIPILHPAYVLRNNKPEVIQSFYQAIQDARNIAYGLPNSGLHAEST